MVWEDLFGHTVVKRPFPVFSTCSLYFPLLLRGVTRRYPTVKRHEVHVHFHERLPTTEDLEVWFGKSGQGGGGILGLDGLI